MLQFICYPGCTFCQRARRFLVEEGIDFTERHIKEDTPTKDELSAWQEQSGLPLKSFFNAGGQLYRQLGLKDELASMPRSAQLELLSRDGMLLKRPILVGEGLVLVGFKEEQWRAALKQTHKSLRDRA